MCGRYTLAANLDEVMDEFELSEPIPLSPRYNIAPTQPAIVVRPCGEPAAGRREGSFLRWGLVPSWSRDASGAARLINARSETAATQPA
ncbi:MAG: SOS response-associated peptidase family protein, partial [Phycisphaerales bacterium]|nr:SOS response-associated peptidase family protein [Phycisphaerales bacterium]